LHLSRLGITRFYQGRIKEAEEPLRRAYELYERLGERVQQVRLLNSLAGVCGETGRLRESSDLLRLALDLSRRTGASLTMFTVLSNLVELLATLGQFDEALGYADVVINDKSRSQHQSFVATLISRAKMFATIGDERRSHADVARARAEALEPLYRAQLAMIMAETALVRGDLDTAATEVATSRVAIEEIGARDELVHLGLLQARLQAQRGDVEGALATARATAAQAREMSLLAGAVSADVLVAEFGLHLDPESAGTLARAALEFARTLGLRESTWRAERVVARAAGLVGDFVACIDGYDACLQQLKLQCEGLPDDLAESYLTHPDREQVLTELKAVRSRLAAT
jgi:tetratricopeptide (TPR) repeat protein